MPIIDNEYIAPDVPVPGSPRETPVEQPTKAPEAPKELTSVAKTLEALNNRLDTDRQNAQLIADPTIRAYLEAKAKGVKVKLIEDTPEAPQAPTEPELPENLETMTNAELARFMLKTLSSGLTGSVDRLVNDKLSALRQDIEPKLNGVVSIAQRDQSQRIRDEINKLQAEFPDFKEMEAKMIELNSTVQGLTPRELYFMAKIRSGVPIVSQTQIETERPADPGQRRAFKIPTNTNGRVGFSKLLEAALDRNGFGVE